MLSAISSQLLANAGSWLLGGLESTKTDSNDNQEYRESDKH